MRNWHNLRGNLHGDKAGSVKCMAIYTYILNACLIWIACDVRCSSLFLILLGIEPIVLQFARIWEDHPFGSSHILMIWRTLGLTPLVDLVSSLSEVFHKHIIEGFFLLQKIAFWFTSCIKQFKSLVLFFLFYSVGTLGFKHTWVFRLLKGVWMLNSEIKAGSSMCLAWLVFLAPVSGSDREMAKS